MVKDPTNSNKELETILGTLHVYDLQAFLACQDRQKKMNGKGGLWLCLF